LKANSNMASAPAHAAMMGIASGRYTSENQLYRRRFSARNAGAGCVPLLGCRGTNLRGGGHADDFARRCCRVEAGRSQAPASATEFDGAKVEPRSLASGRLQIAAMDCAAAFGSGCFLTGR
jgi:hypothetical protein